MPRLIITGDLETLKYIQGEIEELYCDNEDEQDEDVLTLNKVVMNTKIKE